MRPGPAAQFVRGATVVLAAGGVLLWLAITTFLRQELFQAEGVALWVAAIIAVVMGAIFVALRRVGKRAATRLIEANWQLAGEKVSLREDLDRLEQSYIKTLQAINSAIDVNGSFTNGHASRVATYAVKIGTGFGMAPAELERLRDAALLHDIGKIWIPDYVLHKEGPLSRDELEVVRAHPVLGAEILSSAASLHDRIPAVLHHHERFDGTGYPHGLRGAEIPVEARILSLADAFDAMTSDRPFRSALVLREAIEEIYCCTGTQFDPKVVEAFMNVLDDIAMEAENLQVVPDRFGTRLYSMVGNC